MKNSSRAGRLFRALLAGLALVAVPAAGAAECAPVGQWTVPGEARRLAGPQVLARAAESAVVLLGENHESAEHHRWQLQVLAALHARRPELVLALEMFPRSAQPVLDRWVAGELDTEAFLRESRWREVWNFDPALYLPLFHFARMNRVPMVAVNLDPALVRAVGEQGRAGLAGAQGGGLGTPAPARTDYLEMLRQSWLAHLPQAEREAASELEGDPRWQRFLDVQLLWDRAMAEGMAEALQSHRGALVVGILGSGHVMHGWGVPHQLSAMGERRVMALLPWDRERDCAELAAGLADAVFGLAAPAEPSAGRPRLGVWLEPAEAGVRILGVEPDSVAQAAGLREGDVVRKAAGLPVESPEDLSGLVQRQAPGTWLPLELEREGAPLEAVAKFPPDAS